MEPTKAQKNAIPIKQIKDVRLALGDMINDLEAKDGSEEAKHIVTSLRYADGMCLARLQHLGLTVKLVDKNSD